MKKFLCFALALVALCGLSLPPASAQGLWGLARRKAPPKAYHIAEITLRGGYPDVKEMSFFEKKQSYRGFLRLLDKVKKDTQVKAVVFRVGGLQVGMAKAFGMSQALARLSRSGKHTVALLETGSTADYIVALGCKQIAMVPGGMLYIPGIRSEMLYFKKLLNTLGMEGDFLTIGAYKTAPEPFLRTSMSEEQRKQMNRLIGGLYHSLIDYIASRRPLPTSKPTRKKASSEIKAAIDRGLHTAQSAKTFHLVDDVLSRRALYQKLRKAIPERPLSIARRYGKKKKKAPTSIFSLFSMLMQSKKPKVDSNKPKIAVLYAQGPIYYGSQPQGWFSSETEIWSDAMLKTLNAISKLKNLRAVVLRVNSPGGDALASDLIWQRLEKLKQRVPLFVSMGNVAASGGYYIAMGADVLVAQPTTITGSIGVFGGKLVMRDTMKKIGINVESVSRGKHAGIFSPFSRFSESERKILRSMLKRVYTIFTTKAAKGRKMKREQLLQYAGGQVWTGRQAKKRNLVDQLGGLQDTIEIAMKRTGLKPGQAKLLKYPRPKSFFEALQSLSSAAPAQRLPFAHQRLWQTIAGVAMPQLHRLRLLLQPRRHVLLWSTLPQIRW